MISFFINLVDYPNKLKTLNFFRDKLKKKDLSIIDIGSHKGETIDFFYKNFNIRQLSAFEPNKKLFESLRDKYKKRKNIIIYNYGVGAKFETKYLNVLIDSASSTINNINMETDYYKRKAKFFLFNKNPTLFKEKQKIQIINLSNFFLKDQENVDVLKIDTEGFEYNVLRGISKNDFKKINLIYFEHHYDLMIEKKYKFNDIDKLLKKHNFFQKFKTRMKFRKSFEYIYERS